MTAGTLARRLALLEGVPLDPEDLETVLAEFEHYDHALAELQVFAADTPWISTPAKPGSAGHEQAPAAGRAVEEGAGRPSTGGSTGERNGDQLWSRGVDELSRRIAAREVSCQEAVDAVLERLHALEPSLNAFITVL